jgi:hypothetical protein
VLDGAADYLPAGAPERQSLLRTLARQKPAAPPADGSVGSANDAAGSDRLPAVPRTDVGEVEGFLPGAGLGDAWDDPVGALLLAALSVPGAASFAWAEDPAEDDRAAGRLPSAARERAG